MAGILNLLEHPSCLAPPELLAPSHWVEHLPFAMWIVSAIRPRLLVELGTFRGTSFCGFCQCIKSLELSTRAVAVDTWKGDPHNGVNGPEVLSGLRSHHDPRYGDFSSLLEMTFDDAAPHFPEGEIDLLHIDGYHTYEAVRHDYETWRSKLSDRGIILFHDVVERIRDFGVWRFWEEMRTEFPSFEFHHEHGLGVLAVGRDVPESIRPLLESGPEEAERIRSLFHLLGHRIRLGMERDEMAVELAGWRHQAQQPCRRVECESTRLDLEHRLRGETERAAGAEARVAALTIELGAEKAHRESIESENHSLKHELTTHKHELTTLKHELTRFEQDRAGLERSLSWRVARRLSGAGNLIAPPGTGRRHALKLGARLAELSRREGVAAVPSRLLSRANHYFEAAFPGTGRDPIPWIPDGRPVFLQVHHGGGGGIERHLRDLCSGLRDSGIRPVLLAPGPRGSLIWEEPGPDGQASWQFRGDASPESIARLLAQISPVHAHVHSLMNMPPLLLDEFHEHQLSYDWTIHDYHLICPRAHLEREDGRYCGEPDPSGCDSCLARQGDHRGRALGESIESWRRRHGAHLRRARRVFAPSLDAKRRMERYFPEIDVVVRPHPEPPIAGPSVAAAYRPGGRLTVAVIGTISTLKGSRLLQACAEDAARNDRPIDFVVVGRTDRDAALARTGRVMLTGRYPEDEILERLKDAGAHLAFFPSVVPETYMYTLSIAIRAGLFPVCLDLGAQAERLRALGWGLIVPPDASPAGINQAMLEAAGSLKDRPGPGWQGTGGAPTDLLESYYGFTDEERRRFGLPAGGEEPVVPRHHLVGRDAHARLH